MLRETLSAVTAVSCYTNRSQRNSTSVKMSRAVKMSPLPYLLWLLALAVALQLSTATRMNWTSLDDEGGDILIGGDAFFYHTADYFPASDVNTTIKLTFKTTIGDSVLLYAHGDQPGSHFLVVSVSAEGFLKISVAVEGMIIPMNNMPRSYLSSPMPDHIMTSSAFEAVEGSGDLIDDEDTIVEDDGVFEGRSAKKEQLAHRVVTDGNWHTLLISLEEGASVLVQLDDFTTSLPIVVQQNNNTKHFTSFYFGQIPVVNFEGRLMLEPGMACCLSTTPSCPLSPLPCINPCSLSELESMTPFVGCMREVTVNGIDLVTLQTASSTQFIWTGGPSNKQMDINDFLQDDCAKVDPVLSLSTPSSHVPLPPSPAGRLFSLQLSFRQRVPGDGALATGRLEKDDQQLQWQMYCEGTQLYFKAESMDVKLAYTINDIGQWNTVRLWNSRDNTLYLSVNKINNNLSDGFKILNEVTLGDKSKGIVACIKAVELADQPLDLRALVNRNIGVVMDRCQSLLPSPWCQRGVARHRGERMECDCEEGYEGPNCQFDLYPSSCTVYRQRGYTHSGLYALLIAGQPITVHCRFDPDFTVTEIRHNVPQQYEIEATTELTSVMFNISYGGQGIEHQLAEWADDNRCEQLLTFDCAAGLSRKEIEPTMIHSPTSPLINIFNKDITGVCFCDVDSFCSPPPADCECSPLSGPLQQGSVLLKGAGLLPVTGLLVESGPSSSPHFTLSPITCTQPVAPSSPVSLRGSSSFILVSAPASASTSFTLRTVRESALLLRAVVPLGGQEVLLIMHDGNVLETTIRSQAAVFSDELYLNYPLNTGEWQHVLISFSQDQVKLLINGHTHLISAPGFRPGNSADNVNLFLGGSPRTNTSCHTPYLQGCISEVTVNSEPAKLDPSSQYEKGCKEICGTQPCNNGGKCQHLLAGDFECVCQHPFTGPTCNHDTSLSAMSFLNKRSELYRSVAMDPRVSDWNPITKDTSFSYKTREGEARLLFAYDHLQNILNVHMSKPNEIVVIWNSGTTLKHSSINTGHHELNTSREVIVKVVRTATTTEVTVIVDDQEYREVVEGARQLLDEYQQRPFSDNEWFIVLPHYPQPVTAPADFLSVHLGGAALSRQSEEMPGLVGCLDSFVVNDEDISLQNIQLWHTKGEVQYGCSSSCFIEEACAHGGRCLDRILTDRNYSRCDCTNTGYGYSGEDCQQEVSFDFRGSDYLAVQYDDPSLELELSFALEGKTATDKAEMLFYWQIEDLQAGVAVVEGERLVVWAGSRVGPSQTELSSEQLRANLQQGGRHRMHLIVNHLNLYLEFDGRPVLLRPKDTFHSSTIRNNMLFIGGVDQPIMIGGAETRGFIGCISNVKLSSSSGQIYSPLEMYQRSLQDEDFSHQLRATNLTASNRCSAPVLPKLFGVGRTAGPQGGLGDWKLPSLKVSSDSGVKRRPSEPKESYTVIIVCSAIAATLLLLMIIAAAIWCWNRGKRTQERLRIHQPPTTGGRSYRKVSVKTEMQRTDGDNYQKEQKEMNEDHNQRSLFQHHNPNSWKPTIEEEENLHVFKPESYRILDQDSKSIKESDLDGNSRQVFQPDPMRVVFNDAHGVSASQNGRHVEFFSNTEASLPVEMPMEDNLFGNESNQDLFEYQPRYSVPKVTRNELGNRFQEYVPRENPNEQIPQIDSESSQPSLTDASQAKLRIVSMELSGQPYQSTGNSKFDDILLRQPNQSRAASPNEDGATDFSCTDENQLLEISEQSNGASSVEGDLFECGRLMAERQSVQPRPASTVLDNLSEYDSLLDKRQSAQLSESSTIEDEHSKMAIVPVDDDDMFQAEESQLVQPTPRVYTADIISRTQSNAPTY